MRPRRTGTANLLVPVTFPTGHASRGSGPATEPSPPDTRPPTEPFTKEPTDRAGRGTGPPTEPSGPGARGSALNCARGGFSAALFAACVGPDNGGDSDRREGNEPVGRTVGSLDSNRFVGNDTDGPPATGASSVGARTAGALPNQAERAGAGTEGTGAACEAKGRPSDNEPGGVGLAGVTPFDDTADLPGAGVDRVRVAPFGDEPVNAGTVDVPEPDPDAGVPTRFDAEPGRACGVEPLTDVADAEDAARAEGLAGGRDCVGLAGLGEEWIGVLGGPVSLGVGVLSA